jgi:hypothetical protein
MNFCRSLEVFLFKLQKIRIGCVQNEANDDEGLNGVAGKLNLNIRNSLCFDLIKTYDSNPLLFVQHRTVIFVITLKKIVKHRKLNAQTLSPYCSQQRQNAIQTVGISMFLITSDMTASQQQCSTKFLKSRKLNAQTDILISTVTVFRRHNSIVLIGVIARIVILSTG